MLQHFFLQFRTENSFHKSFSLARNPTWANPETRKVAGENVTREDIDKFVAGARNGIGARAEDCWRLTGPGRQGAGPNGPDGRNRKQALEGDDQPMEGVEGASTDTSTLKESGGVVGSGDEMSQNNKPTENSDLIKTPKRNSEGGQD